ASGVQPYPSEVVAELLLQLPADAGVQRLTGAADDVLRLGRTGLGGALLALAAALLGALLRLSVLGAGAHRSTSPWPLSPSCTARASSWPRRRAESPAGSGGSPDRASTARGPCAASGTPCSRTRRVSSVSKAADTRRGSARKPSRTSSPMSTRIAQGSFSLPQFTPI